MTVDTRLMTADELLQMPEDGYRYELVQGELRKMSPAKRKHGRIAGRIHVRLGAWVLERSLGDVYSSDTGFLLSRDPDTVRCPDVSFVRTERLEEADDFPSAPDLAIEVISPTDRYSDVAEKKDEYLRAGVQAVVIVDPRRKTVTIHRATGTTEVESVLTVDDVVPGWQLPLSDIFA
ncbi:MAG TPA: Uma2 family endonuclease [Thermoanaerobaculia bacterium]|jgi:Uma2 family endonuclease|nr:Uma2 family endonuclease [Thermoanaerobaculia bacterium]